MTALNQCSQASEYKVDWHVQHEKTNLSCSKSQEMNVHTRESQKEEPVS